MRKVAFQRDGILYVDNSTLTTLAQCPTRAMVRYGYNLKPSNWDAAPLQAGIAIHQAIETHYTGGRLEDVLDKLHEVYFDWATANVNVDHRLSFRNVLECVESWVLRNPVDNLPYTIPTPEHVEMPFDIQLHPKDPTIRFVGRIDALVGRKAGRQIESDYVDRDALYVLDTKSTGQPYGAFQKQFELSPQLSGYTWAAQHMFPDSHVVGCYINVVHTYLIPRQSGKCRKHGTSYDECRFLHPNHQLLGPIMRTRGELEEWRIDAYNLASTWQQLLKSQEGGKDLNQVPMFGKFVYNACALCELLTFCRGGRRLDGFEFDVEEWIPSNLAEKFNVRGESDAPG